VGHLNSEFKLLAVAYRLQGIQ